MWTRALLTARTQLSGLITERIGILSATTTALTGPDADWINALYEMVSCRMGLLTGAITWIGVGIALMSLAWGGFMWIVDSNSSGERAGVLRNMITGPLVGLTIMFFSYTFAKFLYSIIRYNFEKYLDPDLWT